MSAYVETLAKDVELENFEEEIFDVFAVDESMAVSIAYNKYVDYLWKIANNFYSCSDVDKESFIIESIFKALDTFKNNKNCKFLTYLVNILKNKLSTYVNYQNMQKRKLPEGISEYRIENHVTDNLDSMDEWENDIDSELNSDVAGFELIESINMLSLPDIEFKLLQIILNKNYEVTDSAICRKLNVTRYELNKIKLSVGTKLKEFDIC